MKCLSLQSWFSKRCRYKQENDGIMLSAIKGFPSGWHYTGNGRDQEGLLFIKIKTVRRCHLSQTGENRNGQSTFSCIPLSTSGVYFIVQASPSLGCTKDKGWKTEKMIPSVQTDLPASTTEGVSGTRLAFSQAGVHGVSSWPPHFKNGAHFWDSPKTFSHWDRLAISKAKESSFPLKMSHWLFLPLKLEDRITFICLENQ